MTRDDDHASSQARREQRPRTSPPIEEHGVVGNQESAALVTMDATIDLFCFPRFDSPTVFARLLDSERGGAFELAPTADCQERYQLYLPDTNVLMTRFLSDDGVCEVVDFMPCDDEGSERAIVRRVQGIRGRAEFALRCAPRFDYARAAHTVEGAGRRFEFHPEGSELPHLTLASTHGLEADGRDVVARFELGEDEVAWFVLAGDVYLPRDPDALRAWARRHLEATTRYWREWSAHTRYQGRWRETVRRSGLVLKLLTSREFGAIVAAPTFGLPEDVGGERNWDYRYVWIRDAAFAVDALSRLGHQESARGFLTWVVETCMRKHEGGRLHVMYAIDGGENLDEQALESLRGYHHSAPVRIGNGAHDQLQLDIYGALMEAAALAAEAGDGLAFDAWRELSAIVDWVVDHWQEPDAGIWEVRGEPRRFLSARLMCWVALDRALRIADRESLPAPVEAWREARTAIYDAIHEHFWDEERKAFVQYRGSRSLDAAALLMPLMGFISPTDPRWLSTLDAIGSELRSDAFVYRYAAPPGGQSIDGLQGREGSFTACSFWYVECLAMAGRLDEARLLFEKLLAYANHLGLFSEELGFRGQHLGNFPQALTHLALISAAHRLDALLDQSHT